MSSSQGSSREHKPVLREQLSRLFRSFLPTGQQQDCQGAVAREGADTSTWDSEEGLYKFFPGYGCGFLLIMEQALFAAGMLPG